MTVSPLLVNLNRCNRNDPCDSSPAVSGVSNRSEQAAFTCSSISAQARSAAAAAAAARFSFL